jgi:hypothetical protein
MQWAMESNDNPILEPLQSLDVFAIDMYIGKGLHNMMKAEMDSR